MSEIFEMQKKEANQLFCSFIENNYLDWLNGVEESPLFIYNIIKERILKKQSNTKTLVLVIDNLRFDQWKVLEPVFNQYYVKEHEEVAFSILPTATQYARNAFFAGLMPSEIAKKYPQYWKNEEDEGSKNLYEKELLETNLKRLGKSNLRWSYNKITNVKAGKKLVEQFHKLKENDVNFLVYNFVDMLSHARTEMEVIRELADDESAYRSLTISWLEHSPLLDVIKQAAEEKMNLVITTDHGTIKVNQPVKIAGERNTNTNLRYKVGRGLGYKDKDVFVVNNPQDGFLPKQRMSSEFVFAREQDFFVYPNNYNHFVNYYGNTFQHGGISMEEVLIPYIEMKAK
jgi:hypothetical protein